MAEASAATLAGQSLEELVDEVYDARQRLKAHTVVEKAIRADIDELESSLMARMDEVGLTRGGSARANAILSEEVHPTIVDWDAFLDWAKEQDALFFLQRRVNIAPFKEMHAMGENVPGLAPFVKRKLSITKIGPQT